MASLSCDPFRREAKEKNREGWYMAYIMDTNEEERIKGITVEVGRGGREAHQAAGGPQEQQVPLWPCWQRGLVGQQASTRVLCRHSTTRCRNLPGTQLTGCAAPVPEWLFWVVSLWTGVALMIVLPCRSGEPTSKRTRRGTPSWMPLGTRTTCPT
jgi:hypothetical protein